MKTTHDITAEELRRHPIARNLNEVESGIIAGICSRAVYDEGETIINEGATDRDLVILLNGAIQIKKKDPKGEERVLASVKPPAILGEVGLVLGEARTASGVAEGTVETLQISGKGIGDLLAENEIAAYKIIINAVEGLARRQTTMNLEIIRYMDELEQRPGPVEDDVANLWNKLLKETSF